MRRSRGIYLQADELKSRWIIPSTSTEDLLAADRSFEIVIPYTTPELTRAALGIAAMLTEDLRAVAKLVAVKVVPYTLPLRRPDKSDWLLQELKSVACESLLPVYAELVVSRSRMPALREYAAPGSLVLIATKKHWWITAEKRMAGLLARNGCSVLLLTQGPDGTGLTYQLLSPPLTVCFVEAHT